MSALSPATRRLLTLAFGVEDSAHDSAPADTDVAENGTPGTDVQSTSAPEPSRLVIAGPEPESIAAALPPPAHVLTILVGPPPADWAHDDTTVARLGTKGPTIAIAATLPPDIRTAIDSLKPRASDPQADRPVPEDVGRALFAIAKIRRARNVLVAGAAPGASALWLSAGVRNPGGRVIAIERDSRRRTALQATLRNIDAPITIELGDVTNVLPRLNTRFDLVLVDTTPGDRAIHVDMVLDHCAPGALIISRSPSDATSAISLAATNAVLRTHPAVRATAPLGPFTMGIVAES